MIILVTGKAESGKDTIGEYLCRKYGFKSDSLAAPLKRLVQDVFGIPEEVVYDRNLREQPLGNPWDGYSVRSLLQKIGTDLFRNQINQDVWVLSLLLRLQKFPESNWVVTDVRFPNEKSVLEKEYGEGVLTFKVSRPGKDGHTLGGIKGHESESYSIPADYFLYNDGSFESLYAQIDKIMSPICLPSDEFKH